MISQRETLEWIEGVGAGDKSALDRLLPVVYSELRRMASSYLSREYRESTLQTTGLVHEVYLRLVNREQAGCHGPAHFYGIVSRMMRQILVDHARERLAAKRGGGMERVPFDDARGQGEVRSGALIRLEDALRDLEQFDPDKARLIELRFFAGLTAEESAELLGLPVQTVRGRLRVAQAWLRRQMTA